MEEGGLAQEGDVEEVVTSTQSVSSELHILQSTCVNEYISNTGRPLQQNLNWRQ